MAIWDSLGRRIDYLRLAVTDRCNLRCSYCMPTEGLDWLERAELMRFEEMHRLCRILVGMGITKIRITGGEPFVRRNITQFLEELSRLEGLEVLTLTTNGVLTAPQVPLLRSLGIRSVNLSLDTLDRERFRTITRRDELPRVLETFDQLLIHGIRVKLNAVVMAGINTEDILPLAGLSRDLPVDIRFIEEMPFNGSGNPGRGPEWNDQRILDLIRGSYPDLVKLQDLPHSTSRNYQIPGHLGTLGIIAAYTRSFCGSCNRIRVTPTGLMKTCLYGGGGLNLRDLMRQGSPDDSIREALMEAIWHKEPDGIEAERRNTLPSTLFESMALIGG